MGRPLKEIDWERVEKMVEAGSSAKEICGYFYIDDSTFYNRFKQHHGVGFVEYKGKVCEAGPANIRLMQYMKAMNNKAPGNIQMLLLLGREWLGQGRELAPSLSPVQDQIDKDHYIMELEDKLAELEEARGKQPKTE